MITYISETTMTDTIPQLRVLFFDVFGTCVAQRQTVAEELQKAAQEALESNDSSIRDDVRAKVMEMVRFSKSIYRRRLKLTMDCSPTSSGRILER